MGIKCGIVGLPNVGKSTLFNALTRSSAAQAANYAFCTIDPNVGMVEVPDPRLDKLVEITQPKKVIPTTVEFVDIAGLVAGASQGEGLGNRFLAHIREVDAILHVVRAFEDEGITHVNDRIDPASDIETINTELMLADLETVEKALERAGKASKSGDKEQIVLGKLLERVRAHLADGSPVRAMELTAEEHLMVRPVCLMTAKQLLYIANVDESGFTDNPHLETVQKIATSENTDVVAVCAAIEQELSELGEEDGALFLAEMGLEEPGLNRLIRASYALLGLQTYFTAGPSEARAWTIRIGTSAPAAAGVIHSDFERGFICAETVDYEDFVRHNGEQGAKEAGRLRLEGKEYIVQDGDVMHFRFNV